MEKVIHLTFREHCHLVHGNLQLVHLERDIVSMEIAAVNDILRIHIDNRIVIDGIDLVFDNLSGIHQGLIYGTENLRDAAQRVIWLDFLLEYLLS